MAAANGAARETLMRRVWLGLLAACLTTPVGAVQYHVDAQAGDDARDGTSAATAFRTIQRAADRVVAGDEVIVGPGLYPAGLQIRAQGTATQPITFRADRVAFGRVVLSGADPAIRAGRVPWTLEDAGLGLYSVPYAGPLPTRVLYSGTDLFPYRSLEALRTFQATPDNPGPRHGCWLDPAGQKLYVRLHASGRYGSTNPADHVMAVAPGAGPGARWFGITPPETTLYGCGVLAGVGQAAFVVLEGFTFETPGAAGVFVDANDVTVRNCWFRGCRSGVAGRLPKAADYSDSTNRVILDHCDYTQYPAFQDGREILLEALADPARRATWSRYCWWTRKSGDHGVAINYENGVAAWIGEDWIIRGCRLWDCFETIGAVGNRRSSGLRLHDNRFEGVLDNALEFEDRSKHLFCYRNVFVDVFEPFSWQPLKGPPWPGPIYVYENLVYATPENAGIWDGAYANAAAIFKIGASLKQWDNPSYAERLRTVSKAEVAVPEPGLLIYNNTIWCPRAKLYEVIGGYAMKVRNVRIANNLLVVGLGLTDTSPTAPTGGPYSYDYQNNLVVCLQEPSNPLVGTLLPNPAELRLRAPERFDFTPLEGSPALGRSRPVPGAPTQYPNLGAVQPDQSPLAERAGPLVTAE